MRPTDIPSLEKLVRAEEFARMKHACQKSDDGSDYVEHPLEVSKIIAGVTSDLDVICAAILHDTLEDTSTSYAELESYFGKRVADLVSELTHEGSKEKGYYFPRLKSKDAILIKLTDRLHNLSRMGCWPKKRQEHYLKKTRFWRMEALK